MLYLTDNKTGVPSLPLCFGG